MKEHAEIANVAVEFFQKQFTKQKDEEDFSLLDELSTLVSVEQNKEITKISSMEKVKIAVMELNRNNVGGPDGMTGAFYQDAWNIIGKDIQKMIIVFFCGFEFSRFITHTNFVLFQKS